MHNKSSHEVLLILDSKLIVKEITPTQAIYQYLQDKSIDLIIDKNDLLTFHQWIENLFLLNQVDEIKLKIKIKDQFIDSVVYGFSHDKEIILIISNEQTDYDIVKRMVKLHNEQINLLRKSSKNSQIQDVKVYEEISKLNSDLLNSKRTIEKQNAELLKFNNLLKKMAIEDSLTGCYNRRYFYEFMREEIYPVVRGDIYTLIMIDFNYFKAVNDQYGHDAGDRLLTYFVQIVKNNIVDHGEIFRIGGDEFVILLKDQLKEAENITATISRDFAKQSSIASLSYGIVSFKDIEMNHEFDLSKFMIIADQLMYKYKKQFKQQRG